MVTRYGRLRATDEHTGSGYAMAPMCGPPDIEEEAIMSLDQGQEQIVRAWLEAKQVVDQCPACRARDWAMLEIVDVPVRWPAELHSGGPGFPLMPRGCRNCGYVMFFSAAKMGLGVSTHDDTHDRVDGANGEGAHARSGKAST